MAEQGPRQQAGKGESRGGGQKDGGELGAIPQLRDEHQPKGFPDHAPGRGVAVALFGSIDRGLGILGFPIGGIGRHALGVEQQFQTKAQKQGSGDPGHHPLGQQFLQAVTQAQGDQGDGRQGAKRPDKHPAGPMAHRQDQGHEEGLVAQFRQGDGGEAGTKGCETGIVDNCHGPGSAHAKTLRLWPGGFG